MKTMITRPNALFSVVALTLALTALGATGALADCSISGQISAMPAGPSAPAPWQYTLTVSWDTGRYGLSHFDVFLDEGDQTCSCEDLSTALILPSPTGTSTSPLVSYGSWVECNGDPSLNLSGTFIKFEPLPDQMNEPGPTGTGTFTFYSNYPPAPIAPLNLFMVDKAGQTDCFGQLTGVFPGLPCDPTPVQDGSWGSLKARYGD